MTINSLSHRSSSVALEDLNMRPPLSGKFDSQILPRGDESMLEVCADIIADARAGLNGIDADEFVKTCEICDRHGRDVKQFQEKKPGAVPSMLSPSLIAVFAVYTAELCKGESPYGECNAALRSANRSKCTPFVRFIWFLMHALSKCDPYDGTNVFRGVKADLSADYPKDREVTWFQFSSCTCDIQVEQSEQFCGSSGNRTLFSIELTTGRARIITKYSLVPSEAEVLLPPNSCFKVLGQLDAGNGLVIIQLKELPPNDPIIEFSSPLSSSATASALASSSNVSAADAAPPTSHATAIGSDSSGDVSVLLQQLQGALTDEAVASVSYYRNMMFAAALCEEFSCTASADGAMTDAQHYAEASKSIHDVLASLGSPTSEETLTSLMAQARHVIPELDSLQAAAKASKNHSKAADILKLR
jgi:hypothetical protein